MMKILIVEDTVKINDILAKFSRSEGHQVTQAFSAEKAFEVLGKSNFDLIITDLMLPGIQGETLIRKIRQESQIYIIVITAKTDLGNKIDVLSLGADDYITKPFSVKEILLKLKNLSFRLTKKHPLIYRFYQGELLLNPLPREVYFRGELVKLTVYEYNLLMFLIKNKGQIFSREQLITHCFNDSLAYDRIVDVLIKNLRKLLFDDAKQPRYIKTHYGLGYQFIGEQDD